MKSFPYTVVYTRNRNAYVKIQEDGTLLFSVPQRYRYHQKELNVLLDQLFEIGEKLYQRHSLRPKLDKRDEQWVLLFGEKVAWDTLSFEYALLQQENWRSLLEKRLKAELYEYATIRIETFTQQLGVSYEKLSIRKAKSRRGSCWSDGRIMLNLALVHLPTKYIQYVIAHEVAHLIHQHHQKDFWDLVAQLYPGYSPVRKALKKMRLE